MIYVQKLSFAVVLDAVIMVFAFPVYIISILLFVHIAFGTPPIGRTVRYKIVKMHKINLKVV